MGVDTKRFGPVAWKLLQGIARHYDDYMMQETDPYRKCTMRELFTSFLSTVGFVLPCVYCRASYRQFTCAHEQQDGYLSLPVILNDPDGGKIFVYRLHDQVNRKLDKANNNQ